VGSNPTLSAIAELSLTDILYRSQALEVRRVVAGNGQRQVVTFDSYHEPPGLDRAGFGEAFFQTEGITAIHVITYGNNWFQYAEMPAVLALVRETCSGAERLLSYGSSMGGYAALRFAGAVGAKAALALSPQYSVNPRKAPFETRWASDRRRIQFIAALEQGITQVPLMVMAYDSRLDVDAKHARHLSREADIAEIPLPFAGHPVGPFLHDVELLRPLVTKVLDGTFRQDDFRATAHQRRKSSPHWLANVAERHSRASAERGIMLARRAVFLAPGHAGMHDALARRLSASARFAEAIEAHRAAVRIEPVPDYLWGLSKTLHASGDVAGALEVARRLQNLAPQTAGYHAWAARLHEAQGNLLGALADLRRALDHDRTNRGYRFQLLQMTWRVTWARWRRALLGR
jgi:tetratricopeptide (TPR) repeat protein